MQNIALSFFRSKRDEEDEKEERHGDRANKKLMYLCVIVWRMKIVGGVVVCFSRARLHFVQYLPYEILQNEIFN